jgi:hypothetical protein
MPEIPLSEDHYERLEAVRRDVEDAFVGAYGRASTEDAVEYLLDTYTPPAESGVAGGGETADHIATATYSDLQRVASDVPAVPGSGLDADEMRGSLLAELGTAELASRLAATAGESGDDAGPGSDRPSPDGNSEDTSAGGPMAAANRLLDEHDDRWRESDGDAPYEVDLPDGTTEQARTKDDVRQALFRHY